MTRTDNFNDLWYRLKADLRAARTPREARALRISERLQHAEDAHVVNERARATITKACSYGGITPDDTRYNRRRAHISRRITLLTYALDSR